MGTNIKYPPLTSLMSSLSDLVDATASTYFSKLSIKDHHRDNVSMHLCPLIFSETASFLGEDESCLRQFPPSNDEAQPQGSSNIRHLGRMLGCFAGLELAGTERPKTSRRQSQATLSTPPPASPDGVSASTPTASPSTPSGWQTAMSNIATTFSKVLNSPDPIKEMVGNPPPPPPAPSSNRKSSIRQMLKAPDREYPQIGSEEVKARLEVYFLRLYISVTPHSEENDKIIAKLDRSIIKVSITSLIRSFVSTVSSTTSPTLLLKSYLLALVRESLAVVEMSSEIEVIVDETVSRIEEDLERLNHLDRATPNSSVDGEDEESKNRKRALQLQLKNFFLPPNIITSKWDNTARVEEALTAHLKNLLKYLNVWENRSQLIRSSFVERMLARGVDPELRRSFKDGSFSSDEDIVDLFNAYKARFRSIRLPPSDHFACVDLRKERDEAENSSKYSEESVNQAMKDLKRERIFVNGFEVVGRALTNKRELVKVLTEAIERGVVEPKPKNAEAPKVDDSLVSESDNSLTSGMSSANESDGGGKGGRRRKVEERPIARPRKFDTSKLKDIVSRILLASSRTYSGGDSYTVLYDLFGSPDVVLKPSLSSAHQAVIEIDVKAGRIDVVCKCYYDVFDQESLVDGMSDVPLLHLYGKTVESIFLTAVRSDVENQEGLVVLKEKERKRTEFGRLLKVQLATGREALSPNTPNKAESK